MSENSVQSSCFDWLTSPSMHYLLSTWKNIFQSPIQIVAPYIQNPSEVFNTGKSLTVLPFKQAEWETKFISTAQKPKSRMITLVAACLALHLLLGHTPHDISNFCKKKSLYITVQMVKDSVFSTLRIDKRFPSKYHVACISD